MLHALDQSGDWTDAKPGIVAFCPDCEEQVIPRCGKINAPHFTHKGYADCYSRAESGEEWKSAWKCRVRSVVCDIQIGRHRADIVGNNGVVIKLQHYSLSAGDIEKQEQYYASLNGMVWVINAEGIRHNITLREKDGHHTFRWKHPRWSYLYITEPLFWDFGDGTMFEVKKIYKNKNKKSRCAGWGHLISQEEFIARYLSRVLR